MRNKERKKERKRERERERVSERAYVIILTLLKSIHISADALYC